ncbi:MAG: flippase-like domain-containing protein, partial [Verrucomicrobia bacterium]|nr:flippase-like domain-containing protein [Verrucomicrobiota bacterium]
FWPGLGTFLHRWRERLFHGTAIMRSLENLAGSSRLQRWRERFASVRNSIKKMIGAYQAYASHKPALIQTFLLSLVTHISLIFSVLCLGESLHIIVNRQFYFLMVPAIMCIAAIPITISGLGLREALFVAAFRVAGVSEDKALLLSLMTFATMLIWSVAGGVIYLFFQRTHPSEKATEAGPD